MNMRWLRDLCVSPAVTEAMAGICGVEVAPPGRHPCEWWWRRRKMQLR